VRKISLYEENVYENMSMRESDDTRRKFIMDVREYVFLPCLLIKL